MTQSTFQEGPIRESPSREKIRDTCREKSLGMKCEWRLDTFQTE